jgi:predicted MFS family arabinose efflux permease
MPNKATEEMAGEGIGRARSEIADGSTSGSAQLKISGRTTAFLSAACGLIVANLYYAQPIAGPISASLGNSLDSAGLIVTVTQVGYCIGLLFLVPLGDLVENRALVVLLTSLAGLALVGAAISTGSLQFFICGFFCGLGSVAIQVILPYASHFASEGQRGQLIGNIMSGMMIGVMLARPIASLIVQLSSWRVVFLISAAVTLTVSVTIRLLLPRRLPAGQIRYAALLRSMVDLAVTNPILQRRSFYQASLFAAFSVFWTAVPLLLAGPEFHLSNAGIALFALAGAAGIFTSPMAGRIADRGLTRPATAFSMAAVAAAFLLTCLAKSGSVLQLSLLVLAALLVDVGMTTNLILGQRQIFLLGAEVRSRLNAMYLAMHFVGGAFGSAVGAWAYARGGWTLAACLGFSLPLLALFYFMTEYGADLMPQRKS